MSLTQGDINRFLTEMYEESEVFDFTPEVIKSEQIETIIPPKTELPQIKTIETIVNKPISENVHLASVMTPYSPKYVYKLFSRVRAKVSDTSKEISFAAFIALTKSYMLRYWAKSISPAVIWFYKAQKKQFDTMTYGEFMDATNINTKFEHPTDNRLKFNPTTWFRFNCPENIVEHTIAPSNPNRVFIKNEITYINLFEGFKFNSYTPVITPSEGLQTVLNHIFKVWCGNSSKAYKYVIRWFAQLAQGRKPRTCLYAQSVQGAGKNALTDFMRINVFGQNICLSTARMDDIIGKYAGSSLMGKILVVLEETKGITKNQWGELSGRLKDLATNSEMRVEKKYENAISVTNYMGLIILSNHDAIKLESSDRRYMALDLSDQFVDDKVYFNRLYKCLNDEIGAEMWNYLKSVDIREYSDLGELKAIETVARNDHISASLHPFLQFLKEHFICTSVLYTFDAPFSELYDKYKHWCEGTRYTPESKIKASKKLNDVGLKSKNKSFNGKTCKWITFTPQFLYDRYKHMNWIHSTDDVNTALEAVRHS